MCVICGVENVCFNNSPMLMTMPRETMKLFGGREPAIFPPLSHDRPFLKIVCSFIHLNYLTWIAVFGPTAWPLNTFIHYTISSIDYCVCDANVLNLFVYLFFFFYFDLNVIVFLMWGVGRTSNRLERVTDVYPR